MLDEILQQLVERAPFAPLCPAQIWDAKISRQILHASETELFGHEAQTDLQREMRASCRAGLLLMNDDLSASHTLSQGIETPTGSFWHAIMHRREGDFSNANYWWRKTGNHAAFADVFIQAGSTLQNESDADAIDFARKIEAAKTWLPQEFVAACENAIGQNRESEWLQKIQYDETTALFDWCRARI